MGGLILGLFVPVRNVLPLPFFVGSLLLAPGFGFYLSARFRPRWKRSLFVYYLLFHGITLLSYYFEYRGAADLALYSNFWCGLLLMATNLVYRLRREPGREPERRL